MKICLLGGDGIGPEVIAEAVKVLEALNNKKADHKLIPFEFFPGDIGYNSYLKHGSALPETTLELARSCDATLLGAVTTPPNIPNYTSPVLSLRRKLDLFACVRRIQSKPNETPCIDMVIVRENTEGLYSGREQATPDVAITERVVTRTASERIVRFAFEEAVRSNYKLVTIVHKANVLRETCGMFLKVALEIASEYPNINYEEMLVDTCAMELIRAPERFQVIVTTNLFGDILSDEAAALVGGLGVAASANIGTDNAVFEPVHGSAPDLAGSGYANPIAAISSASIMLKHLKYHKAASRIETAVDLAIESNAVTPDLGGTLSTTKFTDNLIKQL